VLKLLSFPKRIINQKLNLYLTLEWNRESYLGSCPVADSIPLREYIINIKVKKLTLANYIC